jgi:hypothetical protein
LWFSSLVSAQTAFSKFKIWREIPLLQGTLTCNYEQDSIPCPEAPSLYNQIEYGRIEKK